MKHIHLYLIALFGLISHSSVASEVCSQNPQHVRASYEIQQQGHATDLVLWRQANRVAHQYPATQITEMWEHVHQRVKPTRFFDAHQRAIEYQPGERIHGKVEQDWPYRNQLISSSFFQQLTKTSESGSGCERKEVYSLEQGETQTKLVWLPALQLVESFESKHNQHTTRWKLTEISFDADTINQFFERRSDYQSTDYADIGDDHTDPFLTNMVNQGFIEAGASGYYDTDGKALDATHGHAH